MLVMFRQLLVAYIVNQLFAYICVKYDGCFDDYMT